MRIGEVIAVRAEDFHDDHIHVAHSYHYRYGLQPTKTRQERDAPIPEAVRAELEWLREINSEGYLFRYPHADTPCATSALTKALYRALVKIGIDEAERKKRGLCFHSFRHWFASMTQARGVSGTIVQRVTGHSGAAMLQHYTQFKLADYKPVADAQKAVFDDQA